MQISHGQQFRGSRTYCRIPHTETKLWKLVLLQHDRTRPIPFVHEVEEFREDGGTTGHGVKLADTSNHDRPGNTTGIAKYCAVYRAICSTVSGVARTIRRRTVGPELYSSQRIAEGARLRDRSKQLLHHSSPIYTPYRCLVQVAQYGSIDCDHILGYRRHGGHGCEEQIQAHFAVLHLDDGHKGLLNRDKLGDVVCAGQLAEDRREVLEEVLQEHEFGHDDEGIDVGFGPMDTQSVAAEEEDFTARNVQRRLRNAFQLASATHKFFDHLLHVGQDLCPAVIAFDGLEGILLGERLDQLLVELVVGWRGRRLGDGCCDAPCWLLLLFHGA